MGDGPVEDGGDGEDGVRMVGGQKLLLVLVVDLEIMLQELSGGGKDSLTIRMHGQRRLTSGKCNGDHFLPI